MQKITTIAGVENLMPLLSDHSFIQQQSNLKKAINEVIEKKSIYKYNNQAKKLDNMYSWDMSNEIHETDFSSAREFQVFDEYCVNNGVNVHMVLKSKFYYASDLIEVQRVVTRLNLSATVKLHLDLDVLVSKMSYFNVNEFLGFVEHLKGRLKGFSVRGDFTEATVKGEIRLEFFKDIEILSLSGFDVIETCENLKELSFQPEAKFVKKGRSLDLPVTLKKFKYIGGRESSSVTIKKGSKMPTLTHVSFKVVNAATND